MTLRVGSRGDNVKLLQKALAEQGFDPGPADGIFGKKTEAAVKKWEEHHYVNGVVDHEEFLLITSEIVKPSPKYSPPTRKELVERYGTYQEIKRDPMAWWRKYGAPAKIGYAFKHVVSKGVLWVHIAIVPVVEEAFRRIAEEGLEHEIKTFDGCFNPRLIRGSRSTPSIHTWAHAIDLNAKENPLGAEPKMHPRVVEIFESLGWRWGGRFRRKDGMHFEWVRS